MIGNIKPEGTTPSRLRRGCSFWLYTEYRSRLPAFGPDLDRFLFEKSCGSEPCYEQNNRNPKRGAVSGVRRSDRCFRRSRFFRIFRILRCFRRNFFPDGGVGCIAGYGRGNLRIPSGKDIALSGWGFDKCRSSRSGKKVGINLIGKDHFIGNAVGIGNGVHLSGYCYGKGSFPDKNYSFRFLTNNRSCNKT